MRILLVALALTVCFAFLEAASAADVAPPQASEKAARSLVKSQLPEMLQKLGIDLISRARAAECTEEGETCTSNEQCCSGLECTGGPPTICSQED
jgi:hypothetical protein